MPAEQRALTSGALLKQLRNPSQVGRGLNEPATAGGPADRLIGVEGALSATRALGTMSGVRS